MHCPCERNRICSSGNRRVSPKSPVDNKFVDLRPFRDCAGPLRTSVLLGTAEVPCDNRWPKVCAISFMNVPCAGHTSTSNGAPWCRTRCGPLFACWVLFSKNACWIEAFHTNVSNKHSMLWERNISRRRPLRAQIRYGGVARIRKPVSAGPLYQTCESVRQQDGNQKICNAVFVYTRSRTMHPDIVADLKCGVYVVW